jgi:putative zinc finger/helix-turn-helix YgiT family protein
METASSPWADGPETIPCAVCASGEARKVHERRTRSLGRWQIEIDDEFYRCGACEEEFYTPEQLALSEERAIRTAHERHGLMLPEEIRALRERLRLTQFAFEDLLGVGRNTVVRWENAQVWPNAATNALLRLLDADLENARRLASWHHVKLGSAA